MNLLLRADFWWVAGLACLGSLILYCISLGLAKTKDDEDTRQ